MRVFRLCSLWFDNANEEFVSEMIKVGFKRQTLGCLLDRAGVLVLCVVFLDYFLHPPRNINVNW